MLGTCKRCEIWKPTFIPTQAATTDLTVCRTPSLHREQETVSTKGLRAAFIAFGAKSGGRFRIPANPRDGCGVEDTDLV